MTAATTLLTNLLRCVLWLLRNNVRLIGFRGESRLGVDRVVVTVAPSPTLYRLFGEDCAWHSQRYDGAATRYTWFAIRFGIRIEWEDVTCAV